MDGMFDDRARQQGIQDLEEAHHGGSHMWYKSLDERRASAQGQVCSCREYAKARLSCLPLFTHSLLLVKWQD
jgi:hypothetical protein